VTRSRRLAVSIALLAALVLSAGVDAQDASPSAALVPVDPAECTVAPRTSEELRALTLAGIDARVAEAAATPVAADASPEAGDEETGVPGDAATIAAVTDAARLFTACVNAGNLPALAALFSDKEVSRSLGRAATFRGHVEAGLPGTPSPRETPDPASVDAFLAQIAVPVPLPADQQASIAVRDAVVLSDGRVRVIALTATRHDPTGSAELVYFEKVGGGYRYVDSRPLKDKGRATPAATPTA
jgi:hypothetical protein